MWLKKVLSIFSGQEAPLEKQGKVKFFNRKKGYGFIESEHVDRDVFVHVTNLKDQINKGDEVAFEVEASDKGLEARKVRLLQQAAQ
ncbi:cold shock domain-containing protein [Phaeodactylibacter luteus]|uniref:Cold shock domain-containing protein n=1 Tax=Phaeodactylibacter luteus TaxID=1564516 RepID=A0A5C6S872_9BACT|nr:cold shock domain-containing protein [Phaeodactylibacter luteus]TXB70261.1 cold shock domain-containing protein [Phaeodactylibacter luteus]